jgi:hypothetical protein
VEGEDQPAFGPTYTLKRRPTAGQTLIEAEALLPDGRRVFARKYAQVSDPAIGDTPFPVPTADIAALYRFDAPGPLINPTPLTFGTGPSTFSGLVIGTTYTITLGPHCTSFSCGSTTVPSPATPGPTVAFVASASTAQISGTSGTTYDGTLQVVFKDETSHHYDLETFGHASRGDGTAWMASPDTNGHSAKFSGLTDYIDAENISDSDLRGLHGFIVEFRIYPKAFPVPGSYGTSSDAHLFKLSQDNNSSKEWSIYYNTAYAPVPLFYANDGNGGHSFTTAADWNAYMTLNKWHLIKLTVSIPNGGGSPTTSLSIDGQSNPNWSVTTSPAFTSGTWSLSLGQFIGDVDEVRISRVP